MKRFTVTFTTLLLVSLVAVLSASPVLSQEMQVPTLGTGDPATTPNSVTPDVPSASTGALPPAIQGRWLLGEVDGSPEAILDISATNVLWIPTRQGGLPSQLSLLPGTSPVDFLLEDVSVGSRSTRRFLVVSADRALMWEEGTRLPALMSAQRLGDVPEVLRGPWVIVSTTERMEASLNFEADRYVIELEGGSQPGRANGAGQTAGRLSVFMEFGSPEPRLLHFIAITEGVFIVHPDRDDEFVIFYRPGARPSWTEPFLRPLLPTP